MTTTSSEITPVVRELIESVPGCRLSHASVGALGLAIRFTGWTPSLHKGGFAMLLTPPDDPGTGMIEDLLQPAMTSMNMRRHAAMALGHDGAEPLPYAELSHLMIETLVLDGEPELKNLIPALVSRQLQANALPAQDAITDSAGRTASVRIAAPAGDDPNPHIHAVVTRGWGLFDGTTLTLRRLLPETVVSMLPGRRVGDVLDPILLRRGLVPLADRVIQDATVVGRCTSITVLPEWRAFI